MRGARIAPGTTPCCGDFWQNEQNEIPLFTQAKSVPCGGGRAAPESPGDKRLECGELSATAKPKSGRDARAPSLLKTPPANPPPISP